MVKNIIMIPAADIYLYLIFLTLLFIAITLWRMYNIMRKDKSITISKGLPPPRFYNQSKKSQEDSNPNPVTDTLLFRIPT